MFKIITIKTQSNYTPIVMDMCIQKIIEVCTTSPFELNKCVEKNGKQKSNDLIFFFMVHMYRINVGFRYQLGFFGRHPLNRYQWIHFKDHFNLFEGSGTRNKKQIKLRKHMENLPGRKIPENEFLHSENSFALVTSLCKIYLLR